MFWMPVGSICPVSVDWYHTTSPTLTSAALTILAPFMAPIAGSGHDMHLLGNGILTTYLQAVVKAAEQAHPEAAPMPLCLPHPKIMPRTG